METAGRLRFADVLVSIEDPRQSAKVKHDRVELLVVAVTAVLVGADTFVEMELWAEEKLEWLRGYLRLPHGIPSRDTFGRIFGLIDPQQFESAFRRWVSGILPVLGAEIVASDGKTSRRSGGIDTTAPHMVSAFAAGAGMVLGQRATAEKSNEITAIPELLSTLALTGCTVTIEAMGTLTAIAGAIQERGADYVLAVKDNQPKLAESIQDFWNSFRAHPACHSRTHLLRAWKRIMAASKSAAVPSSIDWSVSTSRSNGRGCVASQCSNRNGRSATKLPTNSACISAACPPMPNASVRPSARTGRSRTDCTGSWMCPSTTTRCVPAPKRPGDHLGIGYRRTGDGRRFFRCVGTEGLDAKLSERLFIGWP